MKKTYILPNMKVADLPAGDLCMLTGSGEDGNILGDGGNGDGTDIAARNEVSTTNLWNQEW